MVSVLFLNVFRYCSINSRCSSSLGMYKQSELSDVVSDLVRVVIIFVGR